MVTHYLPNLQALQHCCVCILLCVVVWGGAHPGPQTKNKMIFSTCHTIIISKNRYSSGLEHCRPADPWVCNTWAARRSCENLEHSTPQSTGGGAWLMLSFSVRAICFFCSVCVLWDDTHAFQFHPGFLFVGSPKTERGGARHKRF